MSTNDVSLVLQTMRRKVREYRIICEREAESAERADDDGRRDRVNIHGNRAEKAYKHALSAILTVSTPDVEVPDDAAEDLVKLCEARLRVMRAVGAGTEELALAAARVREWREIVEGSKPKPGNPLVREERTRKNFTIAIAIVLIFASIVFLALAQIGVLR